MIIIVTLICSLYLCDIIALKHLTPEENHKSWKYTIIPGCETFILLKRKLTK